MVSHRFWWLVMLAGLAGCHSYPDHTEEIVACLSHRLRDPEPGSLYAQPPVLSATSRSVDQAASATLGEPCSGWQQVAYAENTHQVAGGRKDPLVIPPDLPGSNAPPIFLPKDAAGRARALQQLYPPLPELTPDLPVAPGPEGRPLTLADLQRLATANNPAIRNAVEAVAAAQGALIQSAAYPNPSVFWESDTVGTGGAGYQGAGFDQVIKGANKIKLARAMATMELKNAELALRKAETELATQVRTHYFGVLVSRENVKVSRALAIFTQNVYRVQIDLLSGGAAAPYEPMQLRPLVLQTRLSLIQATNQYQSSWRQLAAALGLPRMPVTELAGRVDAPVPVFDHDAVLDHVLNNHTDILTNLNSVQKARYNEELARANVFPDPGMHLLVQKDYTSPPHFIVYSASVTMSLPVWDKNRGNIFQARSQLAQALQQVQQTKLQLTGTLADAFGRYTTARQQVQLATEQIQDQVRAYRGVYQRRGQAPDDVSFGDVVAAQQTLGTYISSYITALGAQWQAVVDVANLLQTDDLFQTGQTQPVAPIPHLDQWPPQPCLILHRGPAGDLAPLPPEVTFTGPGIILVRPQ